MARDIQYIEEVVQVPTITITPNDLKAAFLKWETASRLGGVAPATEQSAERTAEVAAATLWNFLAEV